MKKVLVICLTLALAIASWFFSEFLNDRFYAGISALMTPFASLMCTFPTSIYNIVKTRDKKLVIFYTVFYIFAFIFLILNMPKFTYTSSLEQVKHQYEKVYSCEVKAVMNPPMMELPKSIEGCYLFRANEDNIEKYVLFNPKTGETQTYDVESDSFIEKYIEIMKNE